MEVVGAINMGRAYSARISASSLGIQGVFAVGDFEVQWKAEDEDLKLFQVRVEACRFLRAQLGALDKA